MLGLIAAAALAALPAVAGGQDRQGQGSCSAGQLSVKVSSQGGAGTLFGDVRIRPVGGCALRGPVRFAVKRRNGRLLERVKGNPGHSRLNGAAGKTVHKIWGWSDWCGADGHFNFVATVKGVQDALSVAPPPCNSDGQQPSTLRRIRN
jgi:hypothetical protein